MANNLKGLTIEIGGDTTSLSSALKNVNGDISTLQANLRTVNSALKLDPSNVEAVAMKQELLTQAVEATREKLGTLREAQRQADEQMANGLAVDERAYQNLRAEIVRAESSLSDYENQLREMADAAEKAAEELDDAARAAKEKEEKLQRMKKAAQEAADKFEEMADGISEGTDRMSTGFGNLANGAKTIVTAITGAFAAVSGAMLYASESTVEYRTQMAKLQVAFNDFGWAANRAKDTYTAFYGILGDQDQAAEASTLLAALATNAQSLSEWQTIATGVYAKFGDSLPIESMIEAANETKETGQLTGALADALNWAGVNEEKFQEKLDKCRNAQEREALIRKTLNGIYKDAGEEYKETAADLIASNEAQVRYTDAMSKFGEKAQPILTAVRNGFASLLEAASGLLENVDMNAITVAIENAFKWFLETAVPAIKDFISFVMEYKDYIIAAIVAIGVGFAAWNVVQIVSGAIQVITSFGSAVKLVTTAWKALDLAMKMNVIGIVITAVAALVAGFIYLWNNCEGFRNFFLNMWENIKTAFAATVEWFKGAAASIGQFFSDAWNTIKGIWSGVKDFFGGVRDGINNAFSNIGSWFSEKFTQAKDLAQKAWSGAKEHFTNVKNGITNAFSKVDGFMSEKFGGAWTAVKNAFAPFVGYFQQIWNTVKGIFSAVKSVLSGNFSDAWASIKGIFSGWSGFFSGLWTSMKNAFSNVGQLGKDIVRGLWNGINDMVSWISGKIKSFGENVLSGIKNFFGIKSPSTVMRDQVGRDLVRGVGVGIEENADEAIEPMDDLVSEMTGVNIDRNISNTFSGTAVNEFGGLSERLDAVVEYLSKYLPGLADNASQGIYLDGDTLVGTLGGRIDAELARQYVKKGRGQ